MNLLLYVLPFIYQRDHILLLAFKNSFMLECTRMFLGLMQSAILIVLEIVEVLTRSIESTCTHVGAKRYPLTPRGN
jgi:diacylglycerol kinase